MSLLNPIDPEETGSHPVRPAGDTHIASLVLHRPCPACGAPLTMDVLARTLTCSFCRRSHFMTGERTHLTAFLQPRIPAEDAMISAKRMLRERGIRATEVSDPRLVFVPYWRLQTRLFSWHMNNQFTRLARGDEDTESGSVTSCRDIDITFPGVLLSTGLHGLSTRPAVLEAHAFDPRRLPEGSQWIEPEWSSREAFSIALARALEVESTVLKGALMSKRIMTQHLSLTLLYFPFHVVHHRFREEPEGRIFIDAVGGEITATEKPIQEELPQAGSARPPDELAGFLPLVCPQCTFTLECGPLDEVFRCPNCSRAWQADPFGLEPVLESAPPVDPGFTGQRLPMWRFRGTLELPDCPPIRDAETLRILALTGDHGVKPAGAGSRPAPDGAGADAGLALYVPAFESRQPEKVIETAVRFTLNGPHWEAGDPAGAEPCRTASSEASKLLDLCLLRALSTSPKLQQGYLSGGKFSASECTLVWVPFRALGPELVEPKTGSTLSRVLLQPWS